MAMTLNNDALEEQQMAFHCVTQLFQNCGGALRPYAQPLIEQILEGLEAPFMGPQVQLALIQSMRYVYRALPARKYQPGSLHTHYYSLFHLSFLLLSDYNWYVVKCN
jgi:hypothetical protein